jgi:hypothetical protein
MIFTSICDEIVQTMLSDLKSGKIKAIGIDQVRVYCNGHSYCPTDQNEYRLFEDKVLRKLIMSVG